MKRILLAATALTMLGGAAYAQSLSGSNSNSNATVTTGSQSLSVSNPTQTTSVMGNPIGNGASSSISGASSTSSTRSASSASASPTLNSSNATNVTVNTGTSGTAGTSGASGATTGTASGSTTDQSLHYGGSYTVRNTPELIAPSVVGGNPCSVGVSGGVSLPGFGIAGGGTWADHACERRQQAALLFNMGETRTALELMCQDTNVRTAMKTAGKPCVSDNPAAVAAISAPAPMPVVASTLPPPPASVAAKPAAPAPAVLAANHAKPRPEWCGRAKPDTEASKAYVARECGVL